MKNKYSKPLIEEEKVEIEDIIASSSPNDEDSNNKDSGWLPWV